MYLAIAYCLGAFTALMVATLLWWVGRTGATKPGRDAKKGRRPSFPTETFSLIGTGPPRDLTEQTVTQSGHPCLLSR
jgi:hypothetical protein